MALCERPYIVDGMPCGCSTCDVCRIRRKRLWANRIMLESYKHGDSSFITLTYDEDHLPEGGTLVPKDAQDWLKRLRLAIAPRKMRYFLAGEYGDETWRPHYHVAAFGIGALDTGVVQDTWSMGHSMLGTLTPASAAYIAGYVTKKMTSKTDVRLAGRHPEFTRMSLKPGIGAEAMEDFARVLESDHGLDWIAGNGDVPHQFKESLKMLSIGRYLRRKLRGYLGFGSEDVPKETLEKFKAEMRQLLKENVNFEAYETRQVRRQKIQNYFVDRDLQKLRNVVARSKIYSSRKEL